MKKFMLVIVLLVLVASAATASVSKAITVGSFDPTDANLTSVEFTLNQPDVTPGWGTECNLSYVGAYQAFKQDSDMKRYGFTIGKSFTKSVVTLSAGGGVFIIDNGKVSGNGGLYGAGTINITKNLAVVGKFTEVINSPFGTGWQFGIGYSY